MLEQGTQTCEVFTKETREFESLGDFLLYLMGNPGLMHIADKIFGYFRNKPHQDGFDPQLVLCRQVSRAFRDYFDNNRRILLIQIQDIQNLAMSTYYEDDMSMSACKYLFNTNGWNDYGVFDYIAKEVKDVSELRAWLNLMREMAADRCHDLIEKPFIYLIKHHMHRELELLIKSPVPIQAPNGWGEYVDDDQEWPSYVFLKACAIGCGDCVQPFLDHAGDKFIDVNWTSNSQQHCLHAAFDNDGKICQ